MRVCVTGAAGFIGGHVVKALQEADHDVLTLDMPHYASMNLAVDITRPLAAIEGLDAVVHLAAMANPRECDGSPTRAFDVNVNGTNQVLRMAVRSGAKKVVFSSTGHVYGMSPRFLPTPETHPLWLQNDYTTTKILGEQLCHLYYESHGLSYTTLRLFNCFGPGQGLGYFIPDMIEKARTRTVSLRDGAVTKDFVYIEDVARAFVCALETPFVGAVNIGTGVETSLAEIAVFLANLLDVDCVVENGTATRMRADIARAKRVFGWEPRTTLWEGLRAVLDEAKVRPVPA